MIPSPLPSYRLHKPTGQAVVTLNGRDVYLGPHSKNTAAPSRLKYDLLISEWLANSRQLPPAESSGFAIVELIAAYWTYLKKRHKIPEKGRGKNGDGDVRGQRRAMGILKRMYEFSPVADFDGPKLLTIREAMIAEKWSRKYVNRQVDRLRRMFKWGVSRSLVPENVWIRLKAVEGLRAGESEAPERPRVKPANINAIEAIRPFLPPQIAAMLDFQLLTGARPGETVTLTRALIDTSGEVWTYRPPRHKTAHLGDERVIHIPATAQAIIAPLFKPDLSAYLFSPRDAETWRYARADGHRRPDQKKNPNRSGRKIGDHYTTSSYRQALIYGWQKANAWARGGRVIDNAAIVIPPLTPHQLRHKAATDFAAKFDLDTTQAILGHRHQRTTAIYAEIPVGKAAKAMGKAG